MKKIIISLLILVFGLSLSAQDTDSVLLVKLNMLKNELTVIKKKNKNLQSQIYKLKQAHANDLEEAQKKYSAAEDAMQKYEQQLAELDQAISDSEKTTLESLTVMGDWTKKTLMVLAIVVAVLIIVLLVLIITNRRRIERSHVELEKKVDSTREAIDLEIKEVLSRHENDITELKSLVEKSKK